MGATSQLVAVTSQLVGVTSQLVSVTSQLVGATSQLVSVTSQLVAVTKQLVDATIHLISAFPQAFARTVKRSALPVACHARHQHGVWRRSIRESLSMGAIQLPLRNYFVARESKGIARN